MHFFKYFSTVAYTFQDGDTSYTLDLTNFTERVKLAERLRNNITVLYDYVVQDGMRPDAVSQQLYGSVSYTWLILLVNNIFTLYDWPLTQEEFNNYIIERYGSVAEALAEIVYKTVDGDTVDATTYSLLPAAQQGINSNVYEQEQDANEAKRRIKVIPAAFVVSVAQELKKIL